MTNNYLYNLLQMIEEYKYCQLRDICVEFIQDDDNSLDHRWELFLNMPDDWSNVIESLGALRLYADIDRDFIDSLDCNRYERIDLTEMIDNLGDEEYDIWRNKLMNANVKYLVHDW